ncbi:MAG: hypothetical protein ACUVWR_16305 [Anaerolineae bacterium]
MSAIPARAPTSREEAHRLLELVPDEDVGVVTRMLRGLVAQEDPVLAAFLNAPEDDEELTEEDIAAIEEGRRAIAEGRVVPHEEVRRRLGL